jgi:glycosyltransferase involved in cell wall biosynthesis
VGELKALKGQEEFLRAAVEIGRHHPSARFIIAGVDSSKGQERRKFLEQLARELGLESRVIFVDWLDDIAHLYRALDIFVSASRAESFGLAMAEAMASETAVVATATDGAREIIVDGDSGVLVPIGSADAIANAVTALLDNPRERERLAVAGAENVKNRFSLARMVAATEELYRDSLATK